MYQLCNISAVGSGTPVLKYDFKSSTDARQSMLKNSCTVCPLTNNDTVLVPPVEYPIGTHLFVQQRVLPASTNLVEEWWEYIVQANNKAPSSPAVAISSSTRSWWSPSNWLSTSSSSSPSPFPSSASPATIRILISKWYVFSSETPTTESMEPSMEPTKKSDGEPAMVAAVEAPMKEDVTVKEETEKEKHALTPLPITSNTGILDGKENEVVGVVGVKGKEKEVDAKEKQEDKSIPRTFQGEWKKNRSFCLHQEIDVFCRVKKNWFIGYVVSIHETLDQVKIHYLNWNSIWDEWVSIAYLSLRLHFFVDACQVLDSQNYLLNDGMMQPLSLTPFDPACPDMTIGMEIMAKSKTTKRWYYSIIRNVDIQGALYHIHFINHPTIHDEWLPLSELASGGFSVNYLRDFNGNVYNKVGSDYIDMIPIKVHSGFPDKRLKDLMYTQVDAKHGDGWYSAIVMDIRQGSGERSFFVHYPNAKSLEDEWLPPHHIAMRFTHVSQDCAFNQFGDYLNSGMTSNKKVEEVKTKTSSDAEWKNAIGQDIEVCSLRNNLWYLGVILMYNPVIHPQTPFLVLYVNQSEQHNEWLPASRFAKISDSSPRHLDMVKFVDLLGAELNSVPHHDEEAEEVGEAKVELKPKVEGAEAAPPTKEKAGMESSPYIMPPKPISIWQNWSPELNTEVDALSAKNDRWYLGFIVEARMKDFNDCVYRKDFEYRIRFLNFDSSEDEWLGKDSLAPARIFVPYSLCCAHCPSRDRFNWVGFKGEWEE